MLYQSQPFADEWFHSHSFDWDKHIQKGKKEVEKKIKRPEKNTSIEHWHISIELNGLNCWSWFVLLFFSLSLSSHSSSSSSYFSKLCALIFVHTFILRLHLINSFRCLIVCWNFLLFSLSLFLSTTEYKFVVIFIYYYFIYTYSYIHTHSCTRVHLSNVTKINVQFFIHFSVYSLIVAVVMIFIYGVSYIKKIDWRRIRIIHIHTFRLSVCVSVYYLLKERKNKFKIHVTIRASEKE